MGCMHVITPGATVRLRAGRLCVEKAGQQLASAPFEEVTELVLMGAAQITTPALRRLARRGVPVRLTNRHGDPDAVVHGGRDAAGDSLLQRRVGQHRLEGDPAAKLQAASRVVQRKIDAMGWTLLTAVGTGSGQHAVAAARREVHSMRTTAKAAGVLSGQVVPGSAAFDTLRGVEGAATRAYFGGFAACNRSALSFHGRSRRPPADAINAALSLGYRFLLNELHGCVLAAGLDPYLGVLHERRSGRPSLLLDLVEPLRHLLIDRMVLRAAHRGTLRPEHFEHRVTGGVWATHMGLRCMLDVYEQHMGGVAEAGTADALGLGIVAGGETARSLVQRHVQRAAEGFARLGAHSPPVAVVDPHKDPQQLSFRFPEPPRRLAA